MADPRVADRGSVASPAQTVASPAKLQATPQNPLLGLLARALYKARDVLSPAPDSWAAEKGFNIADFLIADAPEEVENWSYGSTPFAVPQLSRIPQAKTTVVERDGKKERKSRAFMAADAAAFAPFGMLDNLAGGAAKGAIRLGGAPEAVASHTTPATGSKILAIRDKGLYAPSIGLTAKTPSDYQSHNPHLVWRAGELDRQFPDSVPPGIFNRDAFTWNPSYADGHMGRSIPEQFQSYKEWQSAPGQHNEWAMRLADLLGDERFTQMVPDKGSHTASILASPKFRSLAEWETSPHGMGALESLGGGPAGLTNVQNYTWAFNELVRKHKLADQYGNPQSPALTQLLEQFPLLAQSKIDLQHLAGSPLGDLYSTARNAPSAMGEMKIYAPSVPAGPDVASVYIPEASIYSLPEWQKAGYETYTPEAVHGINNALTGSTTARSAPGQVPIHVLAPPDGSAPPSAAEALRMFKETTAKGPSMVGAPGLKPTPGPFDQLVAHAEKSWLPPAPSAAEVPKEKILAFLGSDYEKLDYSQIMGALGLPDKGTMKEGIAQVGKVLGIDGGKLHKEWSNGSASLGTYIHKLGGQPKPFDEFGGLPANAKASAMYQKLLDSDKVFPEALAEAGFTPEQATWISNGLDHYDGIEETLKQYYSNGPGKVTSTDPPDLFPEYKASPEIAAGNYGFPEGHPAIKVFNSPKTNTIYSLAKALGLDDSLASSELFPLVGHKLGLTGEETEAVRQAWLEGSESSVELFKKALK